MDAIFERLSSHPVLSVVAALFLYTFYVRLSAPTLAPKTVPWVGKKPNQLFSESRAALSSFVNVPNWLSEGYEKVCQAKTAISRRTLRLLSKFGSTPRMAPPT